MKQLVQNLKSGELKIEEVPVPAVNTGGVLVRNYFSLISSGTERISVGLGQKSLIGMARERPDLARQVIQQIKRDGFIKTFQKVMARINLPSPLGYSCAGVIEKVGKQAGGFEVGERVACGGVEYAHHAEVVSIPKNLCVKIPDNVSFEDSAFTTLGAIALQGVRRAEPRIGDNVAVIGLGLVGQLIVQILTANGCKVLGIDIDPIKLDLALKLGVDNAVTPNGAESACYNFSDGVGADSVIISASTSSSDPIRLAGEISRDKGIVVVVGAVGMEVPRKPYYEKELDLRLSRSYGPGRYDNAYEKKGLDYPIGYVRWTEKRNMEEFLRLVADKKVKPWELVTHIFDLDDALKAYEIITGRVQENYLAILLKYDVKKPLENKIILPRISSQKRITTAGQVNVGVIGAGNFAKGVLLPNLKKIKDVRIKSIATATGLTAAHTGKEFGCEYVASDYNELVNDSDLHAILIVTRHDLHSTIAIEGLKKGKYVFVEKPLAISMEQLEEVIEAWKSIDGDIMVGFNRRFAPMSMAIKDHFQNRTYPISVNYRINAGTIPKDSWIYDAEEGGGRIIGEVCHFVDFIQYIVGGYPSRIYAEALGGGDDDNVLVVISFPDGSIGSINYLATGDPRFPKERVEIFGGGSVCVIDDFTNAEIISHGKRRKFSGRQDKGHRLEFQEFIKAVKTGARVPVDFNESIVATITTFKIIDSLNSKMPEEMNFVREVE